MEFLQFLLLIETKTYCSWSGFVREWNWSSDTPFIDTLGGRGALDYSNYAYAPKSPLSTYWPYTFYINDRNQLASLAYSDQARNWTYDTYEKLPISKDGGDITVVPSAQRLKALSIIYRTTEGSVVEYVRLENGQNIDNKGMFATILPIVPSAPPNHSPYFYIYPYFPCKNA